MGISFSWLGEGGILPSEHNRKKKRSLIMCNLKLRSTLERRDGGINKDNLMRHKLLVIIDSNESQLEFVCEG